MDLMIRRRQPSEGFTALASGNFIVDSPETHCIFAAASCSVHLFGIEKLGAEESIVPVCSLELFGHVAQVACLPQSHGGDLALVLLKTGELKVLGCKHGSLRVIDSTLALEDLVDDYALFLAVHHNGIVAIGSRFGRIRLLQFSLGTSSTSPSTLPSQTIDINLKKERLSFESFSDATIMPEGNERLVSLHLADIPSEWPLPPRDKNSSQESNVQSSLLTFTLWVGIENARRTLSDTTRGCTRVAAVSFPVRHNTNTSQLLLSSPRVFWYGGMLPLRSSPAPLSSSLAPQDGPAFFSFVESRFNDISLAESTRMRLQNNLQRNHYYCFGTASNWRWKEATNLNNRTLFEEHPDSFKVDFDDIRRLLLSWEVPGFSETVSCWHWGKNNNLEQKEDATNGDEENTFLIFGTTVGSIYQISLAQLRQENETFPEVNNRTYLYRADVGADDLPGWNAAVASTDEPAWLPLCLNACGSVEGAIVAMTSLPGGRLVVVTDDHAVVLLRRTDDSDYQFKPVPYDEETVFVLPRCSYSFVHCYQGAGSLVSYAKQFSNGAVMAARGGSFERLKKHSQPVLDSALPPLENAMEVDEKLKGKKEENEEQHASTEEMETTAAAAPVEEVESNAGEDISVGGSSAYGAPGALITIHRDTLLEKMFESKPGDVFGLTGLWPLKRCPTDTHHAAVLLASTGSARVLAVDGGGVFSDVTDALHIASDVETLATGNLDVQDWVAQVTPNFVRAFRLGGTAASLDWHPPACTSISTGTVSCGIIILQCLCSGQHSLVALKLDTSDGAPQNFIQLGDPFILLHEASCIGNLVLSTNNTHALVVVGTYNLSIVILELCLVSGSPGNSELSSWQLLGETSLARSLAPAPEEGVYTPPRSPPFSPSSCTPLSPTERARKEMAAQFAVPAMKDAKEEQDVYWNETWIPGSPLAAAAKDQHKPHALQNTTGATLPASIAVSVPKNGSSSTSSNTDYKSSGLELWVSSRSGDVHCLHVAPLSMAVHYTLARSLHFSEVPPTLALLPQLQRVSPNFEVLAVSDRTSLLRASLHRAGNEELRLHTPGVSCAAPLVLEVPSSGDRLFLLAASTDGTLSLSSLEAHQRSKVVARPLPWRPDAIALDEKRVPGEVAIAGRKWYYNSPDNNLQRGVDFALPHLALVDAASGQILNEIGGSVKLLRYERITGLALVPFDFWEAFRKDFLSIPGNAHRALETNVGADRKYQCFILATSSIDISPDKQPGSDPQGRLMFFACLMNLGEPLVLLETLYFADPVLAVDFGRYDGDVAEGLYRPVAVIATGRRVVSYFVNLDPKVHPTIDPNVPNFGYLMRDTSISLNSAARELQICQETAKHFKNEKYIRVSCEEGEVKLLMYYSELDRTDSGVLRGTMQVESFSSEVFDSITSRYLYNMGREQISLDSFGIIRRKPANKRGYLRSRGHCGDAQPLGISESLEFQPLGNREMLVVTRGGGVIEVDLELHVTKDRTDYLSFLSKGLLLALQRVIVDFPEFKLDTPSVKKYLGLDQREEIYRHPQRLVCDTDLEETQNGSERMATTAEGPLPAAISAEPAALEEILSTLQKLNAERTLWENYTEPPEMLNLSVLRLFLECPVDSQSVLLLTAIKRFVGGEVEGVDIDALVYELSLMGAHSMF